MYHPVGIAEKGHHIHLSDTTIVFWAEHGEDAYAGLGKWALLYALDSTGKAFAVEFGSNNFENDVLYNEKYYEISGVGHSIRCVKAASASD